MSLKGKAEHEKAFESAAEWGGGAVGVVEVRPSQDMPVTPLPGGLCPGPEPRRVHPSRCPPARGTAVNGAGSFLKSPRPPRCS